MVEWEPSGKSTAPLAPPKGHEYAFGPGQVLCDRFEIREPLGCGGIGEVYRAFDRALRQEVALKVVLKASLGAVHLERVRREVAVARQLNHPNILKYFDFHEFPEGAALSMECIEGGTLEQRLEERGPFDEEAVRRILEQVLEALEHLHAHGLVHRDIKPSNLFLEADGTVKVGDFGIVHAEAVQGLTLTGEAIGTPTYMSPEQIQGRDLSPASDYYALGVTLYELVSGRVPFEGTYGEVASAHLTLPPPELGDIPVSGRLRRLILGLLEKNPARRWGSREVRRYLDRRRLPLLPAHNKHVWRGAVLLGLLAAAVIVFPKIIKGNEPTEVVIRGREVDCLHRGERLWTKTFDPPAEGHVLYDVDRDGEREVILAQPQLVGDKSTPLVIPTWDGSGEPGPPMRLRVSAGRENFESFSPRYRLQLSRQRLCSAHAEDLVISLRHETFYPFLLSVWSGDQGREVLNLFHPGWISQTGRWRKGLAFFGGNAFWLHLGVLILTQSIGEHSTVEGFNPCAGYRGADNLHAYYLLENFNMGGLVAEMPDDGRIKVSLSEGERALLEDGRLEGMRDGAPSRSIQCLNAVAQIREHLFQGRYAEAEALIRSTGHTAQAYGLTGWAVVMEWLAAERLARMGRTDEAVRACRAILEAHPTRAQELPVWAGYYRYLAGDYAGARTAWMEHASAALVGGGKQWELYPASLFAALLEGQPEERLLAWIEEWSLSMEPGYHWRRFLAMQKGWIPLMRGDSAAAVPLLRGALEEVSFEPHAAGYFLARILEGTYESAEMEAYAGKRGGNPLYLQWIAAMGAGDREGARRLWRALEREAWESQDAALMVPVLHQFHSRIQM